MHQVRLPMNEEFRSLTGLMNQKPARRTTRLTARTGESLSERSILTAQSLMPGRSLEQTKPSMIPETEPEVKTEEFQVQMTTRKTTRQMVGKGVGWS
jgi:hypothetical protein